MELDVGVVGLLDVVSPPTTTFPLVCPNENDNVPLFGKEKPPSPVITDAVNAPPLVDVDVRVAPVEAYVEVYSDPENAGASESG